MMRFVHMARWSLIWMALSSSAWAAMDQIPWTDNFNPVGTGELTWFGLDVYQATLYAEQGQYDANRPHVLEIRYARSFSKTQLADRSIKEIRGIYGQLPELSAWHETLLDVMADVDRGDILTGVHWPGQKAMFYRNQQPVGEIADPELAARFFDIWLHEQTSEPKLRAKLLGAEQ